MCRSSCLVVLWCCNQSAEHSTIPLVAPLNFHAVKSHSSTMDNVWWGPLAQFYPWTQCCLRRCGGNFKMATFLAGCSCHSRSLMYNWRSENCKGFPKQVGFGICFVSYFQVLSHSFCLYLLTLSSSSIIRKIETKRKAGPGLLLSYLPTQRQFRSLLSRLYLNHVGQWSLRKMYSWNVL